MTHSKETITKVRMAQGMTQEAYSDAEVEFLLDAAARLGLDPVQRQVWYQARADKAGVKKHQVLCTIDGLRVVAEMTGKYEGQTTPQWCGADGKWVDVWTGAIGDLVAARVGVYRTGFREPVYAVARRDAFMQTTRDGYPSGQWGKMGDHMTSKCAEALALRKAFPQQLSGVYTNDEMRAEEHSEPPLTKAPDPKPTAEEKRSKLLSTIEASLAAIPSEECGSLRTWIEQKHAKAVRGLGDDPDRDLPRLIDAAAKRLELDSGEVLAWIATATARAKEAQRGAAVASGT